MSASFPAHQPTSLQQLVKLMHAKNQRLAAAAPAAAAAAAAAAPASPAAAMPTCWLCEASLASPFTLSDAKPLCLPCFYRAYDAFLRPQLAESAQTPRGEFTARLLARLAAQDATPSLEPEAAAAAAASSTSDGLLSTLSSVAVDEPSFVLAPSHSRRRLANSSPTTAAAAAGGGGGCWSCPRCTFYNADSETVCDACGGAKPQSLICEQCHAPYATGRSAGGSASLLFCPVAQRNHAPWHCLACTVINVVDRDACFLCTSQRQWQCSRCFYNNTTRTTTDMGKRYCNVCGHLNASEVPAAASRTGDADREAEQARRFADANRRLARNLARVGAKRRAQTGDGNCLFRALAMQVFNAPTHHMLLRHMAVDYVERHRSAYLYLFDGAAELRTYLDTMRSSGTWGDEVMLHAASRVLGVHIHVVTSEEQRWHLHFAPVSAAAAAPTAASGGGSDATTHMAVVVDPDGQDRTEPSFAPETLRSNPAASNDAHTASLQQQRRPHIFLAYLYPTHYDDVEVPAMPFAGDPASALLKALERVESEETEWVRLEESETVSADDTTSWVTL